MSTTVRRKKQSFVVENCSGYTSLVTNPDYCTACLRHVTECNAPMVVRCGGFNSTKEEPSTCQNCHTITGLTKGKCPSIEPIGCGAFHSLMAKPSFCVNCKQSGTHCKAPRGKGAFIKGCGEFDRDVRCEDAKLRKNCKHCRQVWSACPAANGGMFPWDIPDAAPDMERMEAEKARKMRGMYAHVENDSGHVGTIHSKSIIDIVRLFGANPTPETARQIIKDIDISGDDACSFHELVSYFAGPGSEILSDKNTGWDVHHDSKREYWENLFKQFDTNADGRFSVKELSHLLRHMGDSPLSKQEVSDMFFGMDANSDGNLTMEELVVFMIGEF